jgi:hypothetical protein
MQIEWRNILPVLVSIGVILLVAVLRNYSRTLAAITATMPINIPLALWIVYSAAPADKAGMITFTEGLMIGLIPTFAFLIVAFLAARAELGLPVMIGGGYVAWGMCLGVLLIAQHLLRR